jgi:hypothetical protein
VKIRKDLKKRLKEKALQRRRCWKAG